MRHASIRRLLDYWNLQRGGRAVPERSEIDPAAIRHALADTFILALDPRAGHPFRLAGTRICALIGRELKGVPFLDLFAPSGRGEVSELIAIAADEKVGVVAGSEATTASGLLAFELLLLPLSCDGRADVRMLGALGTLQSPAWTPPCALGGLVLRAHRYLGSATAWSTARETPAATATPSQPHVNGAGGTIVRRMRRMPLADGRLRHGWTVYDGGQS